MKEIIIYICVAVGAYLIGSISPAIRISKFKGKDIMKEGSGNAGATNAVRVLGWKLGSCVFSLDFIKGFLTTFLVGVFLGSFASYIAAVAVVTGHVFSVYHKFKAGKGVAPSIGVVFAVDWRLGLICLVFGLIMVLITRKVSVGSICSAIMLPIVAWFLTNGFFVFAILIAVLVVFSHRGNIVRLYKGEEKPLF